MSGERGSGEDDRGGVPETWVAVTGGGRPRDPNEVVSGPPPSAPFGPRVDPVFPSLPSSGPGAELVPVSPRPRRTDERARVAAVPLARNIFTLTPVPPGLTPQDLVDEQVSLAVGPVDDQPGIDPDRPERDRVYAIAEAFVEGHVRRVAKGHRLKAADQHFGVGTLVVSEDVIPTSGSRHAKLQWAVSSGRVVELRNVRLPSGHLERIGAQPQPRYATPHTGDDSDLAFLLAFLCERLDVTPDAPVAATGAIGLHQNRVLRSSDVDALLDGAKRDQMDQVILPFADGKVNGVHETVRCWAARDTDEAIFSLCSALADEIVVPNLRRRALTKQAYAWASLIFMLVAICGFQLAASFGGHPPVTFVRYLLCVVAVLFVGSFVCTHRFWRLDR